MNSLLEKSYVSDLRSYIIAVAVILFIYSLKSYLKECFLALRTPGPAALPIIGNSLIMIEKDSLRKRGNHAYELFGGFQRLWATIFPVFVFLEPRDLQTLLSSKKHTEKVSSYKLLTNFLGNGLITSEAETWHHHRKLIQPIFHLAILERFVETFSDASNLLIDKLSEASTVLNISNLVNNCVIDVLNEAVLGVPCMKKEQYNMDESPFRKGTVFMPYRISRPWLLIDFIYKKTDIASQEQNQKKALDDFTRKMIQNRRELTEDGNLPNRKCLLDYMLEINAKNPDFTEKDIIDETCTFMLAGQDSVGAAVAFTLFLLAQNQSDQQKCIEELDSIFGDDGRTITMYDVRELKYLEMCIKESLRLYPSVPMIARKLGEDIKIGHRTVPEGASVMVLPYSTHRIPHIYPDPEKFDPLRFTPEEFEKRHPYAYIPFSAGPRNCIGHKFAIIEMKVVISKVLRHFRLLSVPGKETFEPLFRVTVRASGGLWVRLDKRK